MVSSSRPYWAMNETTTEWAEQVERVKRVKKQDQSNEACPP